jgi:hypothetical protein
VVRLHETQVMHKVHIEKRTRPGYIKQRPRKGHIADRKHIRFARNGKNLRFVALYACIAETERYQYSTSKSERDSVDKVFVGQA